jgi:hypothetical protein
VADNTRLRRFVLAAALASQGCHLILGPSTMDTNWKVIETPHFIFNVRPGSFAEQNVARLTEVLEDQYAFELRALDIHYDGRISLFLFESAADSDDTSERSGTAYPETGAVRAIVSPPLETTFGLVSHEANHVIQHNALGPPATSFMNEGLASAIMSERFHPGGKSFLYPWTAQNTSLIPDLSLLVDDDTWGDFNSQIAYNASASFLAYILDEGGAARLKQLQRVRSAEFEARFQQLYGRSFDEAERAWRAFCAAYRP